MMLLLHEKNINESWWYATTAKLSRHVQNCNLIESKLEQMSFSQDSDYENINQYIQWYLST